MRKDKVLVLYDEDEEYASLMGEYLLGSKGLPWKIAVCTTENDLGKVFGNRSASILMTSERSYRKELNRIDTDKIVILNEGNLKNKMPGSEGDVVNGRFSVIDKYQPAEDTLREILEIYMKDRNDDDPGESTDIKPGARLIGVFSPVRRCYQTTFSVLMGRLLLDRGKVLYLSFEFCEGCEELIQQEGVKNLSDLMYFIKSPPSVFSLRFKSMVRSLEGLDYIPAAISGTDIAEVSEEEWKTFLRRICTLEDYSYVILDLSESVRGIFGILRQCDRIYTLTRNDKVAKRKMESYEQVLEMYEYSDVRKKSIRCNPPYVSRVPAFSGNILSGELVDYIRKQIGVI
ncbi:MAG: hypothetical protein K5871_06060 [Lachnospiraceae bacterium]|nr:hypothetical protein [Lachnospiraceae bacterium]